MSPATVTIHPSQFPEALRRDLRVSLQRREVNHKFHYDSPRQTDQWLALHKAFSPSRHDADCAGSYDLAFAQVVAALRAHRVHLIGLGCGGGQKDTRLLRQLQAAGCRISYTPSDVSVAMTLVARAAALAVLPAPDCAPLVCDLATTDDLPTVLESLTQPDCRRVLTFFGMIPNFEPAEILPRLAACLRADECLLFSANLAPGADYQAGVERVLPQYDNALTRDWLLTFLRDRGVATTVGEVRFAIETTPAGWKRIVARFHFSADTCVPLEQERFEFRAGESVRLFFSYRYPAAGIVTLLRAHGFQVQAQWITRSAEEGVFVCKRRAAGSVS
jgi:uncharacterized SAM-dependent methyltransferase